MSLECWVKAAALLITLYTEQWPLQLLQCWPKVGETATLYAWWELYSLQHQWTLWMSFAAYMCRHSTGSERPRGLDRELYRLRNRDWKHPFNLLALSVSPAHAHLCFSTATDSVDYGLKWVPGGDTLRATLMHSAQLLPHFLPSFTRC
jgi:hypothetical protein